MLLRNLDMPVPHRTTVRRARKTFAERTAPSHNLRCSWSDPAQLKAMVLAAFGFTTRAISARTNLTPSQINYRKQRAGVRTSDYRNMEGTSIAAQIARATVNEMQTRYTGVVRDALPNLLPTKKDSKTNGNGTAPTLAHAGRGIRNG